MKKKAKFKNGVSYFTYFVIILVIVNNLILLSSCNNVVTSNNINYQSDKSSSNADNINPVEPNSPSNPEILNQIIWASTGVGEGGSMPGPLGSCNNCDVTEKKSQSKVSLTNFEPNQTLLLVAYKQYDGICYNIADFYKTWIVSVDSSGNLDVKLSGDTSNIFIYSVYDHDSGVLQWQWNIPLVKEDCKADENNIQLNNSGCNSSKTTRIHIGDKARITYTTGDPVRLRAKPTTQSEIITLLAEGTQFLITDGPSCSDGYTWWYIELDHEEGWVAEGTSNNWFIEPLN